MQTAPPVPGTRHAYPIPSVDRILDAVTPIIEARGGDVPHVCSSDYHECRRMTRAALQEIGVIWRPAALAAVGEYLLSICTTFAIEDGVERDALSWACMEVRDAVLDFNTPGDSRADIDARLYAMKTWICEHAGSWEALDRSQLLATSAMSAVIRDVHDLARKGGLK